MERMVKHFDEDEFFGILLGEERLKAFGFTDDGGIVNYNAAIYFIKFILEDVYIRHLVLQTVAVEFPHDMKKLLGLDYSDIKLEWSEDFVDFLRYRKRGRKISTTETFFSCTRHQAYTI